MLPWNSDSEYCGVDGSTELLPKSFSEFSKEDQSIAFTGLINTICNSKRVASRLRRTRSASPLQSSSMFFEMLLSDILVNVRTTLQATLRPSFTRINENGTRIRGRIELLQSLKKNFGLKHRHVCSHPELNFDDPLLRFIKKSVEMISVWYPNRYSFISKEVLCINELLSETFASENVFEDSLQLLCSGLRYSSKYGDLEKPARNLALLISSRIRGLGKVYGETKMPGVILNLNYPFQDLISLGLRLNQESEFKFCPDETTFNEIKYVGGDHIIAWMNPDCRGTLSKCDKKFYLVCDAKHKIISAQLSDVEVESDSSPSRGEFKIKKSDFYQIISYAQTHGSYRDGSRFYVICGLKHETSPTTGAIVEYVNTIQISFGGRNIKVVGVSVRFGSLLWQIGNEIRRGSSEKNIIRQFGHQLLSALPTESAVSSKDAA